LDEKACKAQHCEKEIGEGEEKSTFWGSRLGVCRAKAGVILFVCFSERVLLVS